MKKIVAVIFIIIIIVACVFGYIFTNGFTADFKQFIVKNGNDVYMFDTDNVLRGNRTTKFDIIYVFGIFDKTQNGYDIKIVPNKKLPKTYFTVDEIPVCFNLLTDCTRGFDIVKNENDFSINLNTSITNVLQKIYDGKTIKMQNDVIAGVSYFTMQIISYNGSETINIDFCQYMCVEKITLTPATIVF